MKNLNKIAKKINNIANLNIFENCRRISHIEARSLFCYIAYKYNNLTYHEIAAYLKSKGKSSDHSTVLYAVKQFEIYSDPVYSKNGRRLNDWLEDIIGDGDYDKQKMLRLINHKLKELNETQLIYISRKVDFEYERAILEEVYDENGNLIEE